MLRKVARQIWNTSRICGGDDEGVGGDDAADCLRYLVATKAPEVRVRKLRGI
jgi:hypothetical protein